MVLAPGSFTGNKHLGAQTYDVTALLHEGENELLIALGDGDVYKRQPLQHPVLSALLA